MANTNAGSNRPRLSVAMIVRDAADVLADTLDTVRSIADEIVVADLGSTDGSYEVARDGADIALTVEWQESFAAARNDCMRHVTGDWVLWVEAGETLDDTAAQQLRNFVVDAADPQKAYLLFIQRPATSPANCAEQIGQLRLMPNRRELQFTGRVREQILSSVKAAGMGVDLLDCVLNRSASSRDAEDIRIDARWRLNLANLALTEASENLPGLLCRAEALAELNRQANAVVAYKRVIELAEPGSSAMLEAYYGLLTAMDADATAHQSQLTTCLEALEIFPLDAQLLCGMGSYLLRAQRLDLAARAYETAVTHGKVDPTIWHLADLADIAAVCWSLVLQLLGDSPRAEAVVSDALADRPESARLRRQLIELCVKAGREHEALAQVELLPDELGDRRHLPQVVRGAVLVAANKAAEGLIPLTAAYHAGCRDTLCLRWLAMGYLALGQFSDVEKVAAEWDRLEPGSLETAAFRRAAKRRCNASLRIDPPSPAGLPIASRSLLPEATSEGVI